MAAISDKIVQHTTDGSTVDYYLADLRTATFYSAFGAIANSYNIGNIKFAFNGQRRSIEISSTAQTALYWEYNSDIGRRNNLDNKPTVGISEYATFFNNPVLYIDILGDSGTPPKYWYIGNISKFKTNGTISGNPVVNIPNAIGNGAVDVLNVVPALWNSAVRNLQALNEGNWKSGISNEIKAGFNNASDAVYNSVNGAVNTPVKQQFVNFGNFLNNPQTLETGVTYAIPFGISAGLKYTGTLLRVETSVTDKMAPLNFGNRVHYDPLNGKPSLPPALPTELSNKYPLTDFSFTRRGQLGADVKVIGGAHPSTYPGSFWDPANLFGDFKPDSVNGAKTFKAEVKSGKLPANTQMLPYDTKTGKLK